MLIGLCPHDERDLEAVKTMKRTEFAYDTAYALMSCSEPQMDVGIHGRDEMSMYSFPTGLALEENTISCIALTM